MGEGQSLAADPASGDVLALSTASSAEQVVRRLDGRTGSVEWVVELSGAMTYMALDPSSGRVVLAGFDGGVQQLVFVSGDGAVLREVATNVTARVLELEVDESSGQVCTLGPQGRSNTEKAWVTSCWTSEGEPVFTSAWSPPDGQSQPSALAIDPISHRVYAAGTSRPYGEYTGRREEVVLLAHAAEGTLLWQGRSAGAVFPSYVEMSLDPGRGRIHLLGKPAYDGWPMRLFSFGADGRRRFRTGWRDQGGGFEAALAVAATGSILTASATYRHASLRSFSPSGRPLGAEVVRLVEGDSDGTLQKVVIDPRRRRAHVLAGNGYPDYTARVRSFTFGGRQLSRPLVDRRKDIWLEDIAVHLASGRVFAATTRDGSSSHRITALSP